MIRTFDTHKIRKQQELTGCLWEFEPCQGELAGKIYKVATPCCWENIPDFAGYRGEGIFRTRFDAEGTIRLEF
jgi:beta-glucuronidase